MEEKKQKKEKIIKYFGFFLLILITILKFREPIADGMKEMYEIAFSKKIGIVISSCLYMLIEGIIIHLMSVNESKEMTIKKGIECAYYCSFFRLSTLGSGSGIAEVYYLSRYGLTAANATGISLMQYLMQKIAIIIIGGLSYLLFHQKLEYYIGDYNKYVLIAVIITILIGIGISAIALSKKCSFIILKLLKSVRRKHNGWKEKIDVQISSLQQGAKKVLENKGKLLAVLILNICKYCSWFMIPYLLFGDIEEITITLSIVFMSLVTMLAGVIPIPSGYGTLEFSLMLMFQPILGERRVVSLILLYRIATTIFPFIIGGFVIGKRNKTI